MKNIFLLVFILFSFFPGISQFETFDLLKFKVSDGWQQQSRKNWVSYTSTGQNQGIDEMIFYGSKPAAPRFDSSFRMEWRRLFDSSYGNPPLVNARKRYTSSGIIYVEGGAEMIHDQAKIYMQLMVFLVEDKMQSILLQAADLATYKKARDMLYDFIESIDTVKKRSN